MPSAAVCVTGLERSFGEIGANIREGVYTMLGPNVSVFGVTPPQANWSVVASLLPLRAVEPSRGPCWSDHVRNATIAWMHCDFRLRGGDCRISFLQQLCDLAQVHDFDRMEPMSPNAPRFLCD